MTGDMPLTHNHEVIMACASIHSRTAPESMPHVVNLALILNLAVMHMLQLPLIIACGTWHTWTCMVSKGPAARLHSIAPWSIPRGMRPTLTLGGHTGVRLRHHGAACQAHQRTKWMKSKMHVLVLLCHRPLPS